MNCINGKITCGHCLINFTGAGSSKQFLLFINEIIIFNSVVETARNSFIWSQTKTLLCLSFIRISCCEFVFKLERIETTFL